MVIGCGVTGIFQLLLMHFNTLAREIPVICFSFIKRNHNLIGT